SIANRAQGHRQITEVYGKRSKGVIAKERPKDTAPKIALVRDTPASESQSHVPKSARNSLTATASVKARARGSANIRKVSGEKAADCALPARVMPQPYQRCRRGNDPSFQAICAAFAHGAIWVAASFKLALCRLRVS